MKAERGTGRGVKAVGGGGGGEGRRVKQGKTIQSGAEGDGRGQGRKG